MKMTSKILRADQEHQTRGGQEQQRKILADVPRESRAERKDRDHQGQGQQHHFQKLRQRSQRRAFRDVV